MRIDRRDTKVDAMIRRNLSCGNGCDGLTACGRCLRCMKHCECGRR